jgi:preprotein translocase SecE subunit
VARDRKRAKQRRERGGSGASARGARAAGALKPSEPTRADMPASLDHASGEVDQFEAALVRGADGVVAEPDSAEREELAAENADSELADGADGAEDMLQAPAATGGGAGGRDGGGRRTGGEEGERPSGAPLREGNRVIGFLRASWAELQRVQWPDRRQVAQATAVVLGFVAIAGLYLGAADFVAKEIVEYIL